MPRNVRNFWLEADVDGRSTRLEGGPVSKAGGFVQNLFMRGKGGSVEHVARIDGMSYGGDLILDIVVGANRLRGDEWPESMKVEFVKAEPDGRVHIRVKSER